MKLSRIRIDCDITIYKKKNVLGPLHFLHGAPKTLRIFCEESYKKCLLLC